MEIATPVTSVYFIAMTRIKRPHPSKDGDCHTSDIGLLYRNDREFECGNPPRTTGHVPKSVSFRTSPQTGVGIPRRTAGEYKIVNT